MGTMIAQMGANSRRLATQIVFVLGLTTFLAPGFDADAYVLLDNFRRFF